MPDHKIRMSRIAKTYFQDDAILEVLADVSLTVDSGEFVSLIGPSGCGKSTLFKIITGLDSMDKGELFIDGIRADNRIRRIGYMPQKDQLMHWKTLMQNLVLPLEIQGVKAAEAQKRVQELLPVFGLDGFEKAYPRELSGGMRQRAALLRTVLIDSDLLLLDEPFGALDAINREKMQRWLLTVWGSLNRTVLFITHSVDEAILLSDRVYVMSQRPGKIVAEESIAFPRPRDWNLVTTLEFIHYKEKLVNALL